MGTKEDYLRVIYELLKENPDKEKGVKSIDISKILKISKASVSEMIKKLAKENLIITKPYSNISLTAKGRKIAEKITDKHEIIEKFIDKLNHKNSHEEAHKLEHVFSDELINKIINIEEIKIKEQEKITTPPHYIG